MSQEIPIPKGWARVTLGDVATEYSVRVNNPAESEFERFVGSNHIGRFELTTTRWGSTSEVASAMKIFQPGDYLLVRRSLYASDFRERAARASFAGVCSGDILTIKENKSVVADGFLSVVLNTSQIWAYIVAHATGSITRRIKWRQLREYEFALPPLEEQRRIVSALSAVEEQHGALATLLASVKALERSVFAHALRGALTPYRGPLKESRFGAVPSGWELVPINSVATVAYGISEAVASNRDASIGWPIITGANVTLAGTLDLAKRVYVEKPTKREFILQKGDLLLNWRSGSEEHVGKTAMFDLEGNWTYASFLLRIRPSANTNRWFLWRLLNHMREFRLFGTSTSQQINFKMNAAMFREVEVIVPPLEIQDLVVSRLREYWEVESAVRTRMAGVVPLRTHVLESVA